MEDMKTGYIVLVLIDGNMHTFFSEKPNLILEDPRLICENTPEDCMGEKPTYELVEMKRIKYIEED